MSKALNTNLSEIPGEFLNDPSNMPQFISDIKYLYKVRENSTTAAKNWIATAKLLEDWGFAYDPESENNNVQTRLLDAVEQWFAEGGKVTRSGNVPQVAKTGSGANVGTSLNRARYGATMISEEAWTFLFDTYGIRKVLLTGEEMLLSGIEQWIAEGGELTKRGNIPKGAYTGSGIKVGLPFDSVRQGTASISEEAWTFLFDTYGIRRVLLKK